MPPPSQSVHLPAPTGGINTIDPLGAMPETDAIALVNLVAGADNGLRTRLGYREWCTGLTGATTNDVRSVLPFAGSKKNGSTNKLFACTSSGIWDVTASSTTPTKVQTFTTTSGDAGFGTYSVVVGDAGHFLLYADEENGLFVYSEATASWTQPVQAASTAWAASTSYALNAYVLANGLTYKCTTAGTSASSGTGPSGTGASITDGNATWAYTPSIGGVNPANICAVTVFKSRVWYVQKDSASAWYTQVGVASGPQIYGQTTQFNFGSKFRAGGDLRNLFNWTVDGGSGLDTNLVAISGGGDVAIYAGIDPSSASTFGMKGVWYVGGVPYGRRIATEYGGDLLIMSTTGILPLSRLVIGNPVVDRTQYATAKIAPTFNALMVSYAGSTGWSMRLHPQDNTLIVTVPSTATGAPSQLAMSLSNRAWSSYRNLPMLSCDVFGGQMYFGTPDGRVCVNTDYIDGVTLANPNTYTPVSYSLVTAYSPMGSARMKRVHMIRPIVLTQGGRSAWNVVARHGFDVSEATGPSGISGTSTANAWDSAVWDSATWSGAYAASQAASGASGISPEVAVAMAGTAISKTTIVGFDVVVEQGGFL